MVACPLALDDEKFYEDLADVDESDLCQLISEAGMLKFSSYT